VDDVHVGDALVPGSLAGAADDMEVVVSALGASLALGLAGRRSYSDVDLHANLNLLELAEHTGVRRFVYVGVHNGPGYEHTRYVAAHDDVVAALEASSLDTTVVRTVAVFTAFGDFLEMAKRGRATIIGDGSAQTNPIHPRDVARAVVANLANGPASLSVGGPQTMSRRAVAELAFEALGKEPVITTLPTGAPRWMSGAIRPFHPRLGELLEFLAAVSTHDSVGPHYGKMQLLDYYRHLAKSA
jgi:uncharacterized protein YbjT (DUF2867 family)